VATHSLPAPRLRRLLVLVAYHSGEAQPEFEVRDVLRSAEKRQHPVTAAGSPPLALHRVEVVRSPAVDGLAAVDHRVGGVVFFSEGGYIKRKEQRNYKHTPGSF
jgi:hypothetical protein